MRIKGLECIVAVLKCMVEWSRDMYVNPHSQSNLSNDHKSKEREGDPHLEQGGGMRNSVSASDFGIKDDIEQIQNLKQQKEILEHGINLFNRKPGKGIEFLQKQGLVGTEPRDIAQFLHKGNYFKFNDNYPYQ